MTDAKNAAKTPRKQQTLEEQIAYQAEKLRKLQDLKKDKDRKERERNQRTVMELIKTERLDVVPADKWKDALPQIKALLVTEGELTEASA